MGQYADGGLGAMTAQCGCQSVIHTRVGCMAQGERILARNAVAHQTDIGVLADFRPCQRHCAGDDVANRAILDQTVDPFGARER